MRLLRKQTDLPFLLAVGLLLLLSASFLAVQLWSDGSLNRGAAEALEAPVKPKALELNPRNRKRPVQIAAAAAGKKSRVKKAEPAVDEADAVELVDFEPENESPVESPEEAEDKTVEETQEVKKVPAKKEPVKPAVRSKKRPLQAPVKAREVKSSPARAAVVKPEVVEEAFDDAAEDNAAAVTEVVEEAADKTVEEVSKPAEPVVVPVAMARPEESVKSEASVKAQVKAPVKAPVKAKKVRAAVKSPAAAVEEDITVVPPEWNWFNTPLRAEIKDGHVEIVAAETVIKTQGTLKKQETPALAPVVVEPKPVKEIVHEVQPVEKPFSSALSRMAKIRRNRQNRADKKIAAEPISRDLADVSPSLRRINDMVQQLKARLDKRSKASRQENTTVSSQEVNHGQFEEAAPLREPGTSEDKKDAGASKVELRPFYSGSGSNFSLRINDLVYKGQQKTD